MKEDINTETEQTQAAATAKGRKAKAYDYSKIHKLVFEKHTTGILALDCVLGGGYEKGDIIEVSSESGVGKTTLMVDLMRNLIEDGQKVAYVDVERGVKTSMLETFELIGQGHGKAGFDPTQGNIGPFQIITYADCEEFLIDIFKNQNYDHVIIDSITTLVSRASLDSSVEDPKIAVDARLQSDFLKKFKVFCRDTGKNLWLVNQMRTKMEPVRRGPIQSLNVFSGSAGGKAMEFFPDIRIRIDKGSELRRDEKIFDGDKSIAYGSETWIYAIKNRGERGGIKVPMTIEFGQGISNKAFLRIALENGNLISAPARWVTVNVTADAGRKFDGTENLMNWIGDNYDELVQICRERGLFRITQGPVD